MVYTFYISIGIRYDGTDNATVSSSLLMDLGTIPLLNGLLKRSKNKTKNITLC